MHASPVRSMDSVGKAAAQRASSPPPRRTAAAVSPCSAPASTACCGPRRSSPGAPSATPRTSRRPTRPAGTAAAGPARRSRSRCSATRARPGTASSGSRRPPARCSPAALAEHADRRVYLRAFAVVGARSSDLAGQVDRALPIEPDVAVILIGVNDVTHRVLPAAVGAAPRRGRPAGSRDAGVAVARRHLPRPRHRQADRPAAQAGRRAPGRAGWPPRRRSRSSRAAAAPSRSARSSGRSSPPRPALLFGPDQFHPSADGYRSLAAVLLPVDAGRARPDPRRRGRARGLRGEGVLPIATAARPGRQHARHRARRHRGRRPRRGVRGLWVELRHRRRQPHDRGPRRRHAEDGRDEEPAADRRRRGRQKPTPVGGPGPSRPRPRRS